MCLLFEMCCDCGRCSGVLPYQQDRLSREVGLPRIAVYLCGAPGMMDAVEAAVERTAQAVPSVSLLLHKENFQL